MISTTALPRQIVDLLRVEYGDMVDFAIDSGRIAIVEEKGGQREREFTA